MLICNVVGARPNFMKIAPIVRELERRGIPRILVHTGQHYDETMSQVFFNELHLPEPDVYLNVGSDSHARQTARVMTGFEAVCLKHRPTMVIVGGDVNSTVAAALVASKLQIPVAHVEAGLRSFDRSMPEELNRIVTDHLSDALFTTEESGNENLRREGVREGNIYFVGNCMVDTLLEHKEAALAKAPWNGFSFAPGGYALLTLHRPSNVDDPVVLTQIMASVAEVAQELPVLFPVHPRTRAQLGATDPAAGLICCEPLPYLTFLGLMAKARLVLTDSGGIQEETTVLNVPCLTLRWNTERPVTVSSGTNNLVGTDAERIRSAVAKVLNAPAVPGAPPPLWDGCAAVRVVEAIARWHEDNHHHY